MSHIGIYTLMMMGAAFIIGFVVAYLIKFISFSLNFFEEHSLKDVIEVRKRYNRINKIRRTQLQEISEQVEREFKDELLEFYYPSDSEEELPEYYYSYQMP